MADALRAMERVVTLLQAAHIQSQEELVKQIKHAVDDGINKLTELINNHGTRDKLDDTAARMQTLVLYDLAQVADLGSFAKTRDALSTFITANTHELYIRRADQTTKCLADVLKMLAGPTWLERITKYLPLGR